MFRNSHSCRTRGGSERRQNAENRSDVLLSVSQCYNIPFILRPASTLPSGRLVAIRFSLRKQGERESLLEPSRSALYFLLLFLIQFFSTAFLTRSPSLHSFRPTPRHSFKLSSLTSPHLSSPPLSHDASLRALFPPPRRDSDSYSRLTLPRRSRSLSPKWSSRETTSSQSRSPPEAFFSFIRFFSFYSSYSIPSSRISDG